MKLTIRQLRRIIRESISGTLAEGELNKARKMHLKPNEIANLLGWDWDELRNDEKVAMGDVVRGIMLGFNDHELEQLLQQLPAEKNLDDEATYEGGFSGDVYLNMKLLIKRIKVNYVN
jgi:hypothetical protein